jgi:hypothetical protein
MPYYRTPDGWVHVKMMNTKWHPAPKQCRCDLGPGLGICAAMATILCDFPVDGTTCDMPICADHATEVGVDRHYCPRHANSKPPQGDLF